MKFDYEVSYWTVAGNYYVERFTSSENAWRFANGLIDDCHCLEVTFFSRILNKVLLKWESETA